MWGGLVMMVRIDVVKGKPFHLKINDEIYNLELIFMVLASVGVMSFMYLAYVWLWILGGGI